ncbi:unnamed protein product [Absidia cylindrospora]
MRKTILTHTGAWGASYKIVAKEIIRGVDWKLELVRPPEEPPLPDVSAEEIAQSFILNGRVEAPAYVYHLKALLGGLFGRYNWERELVMVVADALVEHFPGDTERKIRAASEEVFVLCCTTPKSGTHKLNRSQALTLRGEILGDIVTRLSHSSSTATNTSVTLHDAPEGSGRRVVWSGKYIIL